MKSPWHLPEIINTIYSTGVLFWSSHLSGMCHVQGLCSCPHYELYTSTQQLTLGDLSVMLSVDVGESEQWKTTFIVKSWKTNVLFHLNPIKIAFFFSNKIYFFFCSFSLPSILISNRFATFLRHKVCQENIYWMQGQRRHGSFAKSPTHRMQHGD